MLGTGSFGQICQAVEDVMHGGKPLYFGDIRAARSSEIGRVVTTGPGTGRTCASPKGCDNCCAFCAIPAICAAATAAARSRRIVQEARELADLGVKELIVIAQDITRCGHGPLRQAAVSRCCCGNCAKIDGIRLDPPALPLPRDHRRRADRRSSQTRPKIVKYLDIPIQHIDNDILRRMNRRGTGDDDPRAASEAARAHPGSCAAHEPHHGPARRGRGRV